MTSQSRWRRALTAVLLLGACGGGDDVTTASETTTSSASTTTTTAAPSTTVVPKPAECTDAAGDASAGADLVKVTLAKDGTMLTATYDLGGDVGPAPDGASWIIAAKQGAGDDFESYQLGFKMVGDEVFRFFTDLGPGGKNTYFETPYKAAGRSVVASFPLSALSALRGPFVWSAVSTFAGNDADQCPAEGTSAFTL